MATATGPIVPTTVLILASSPAVILTNPLSIVPTVAGLNLHVLRSLIS
jgi:hypothetical protein